MEPSSPKGNEMKNQIQAIMQVLMHGLLNLSWCKGGAAVFHEMSVVWSI